MKKISNIKKTAFLCAVVIISMVIMPLFKGVEVAKADNYFDGENMQNTVIFLSFNDEKDKNSLEDERLKSEDNKINSSEENSENIEVEPEFNEDFFKDVYYMYEEAPSSVKKYLEYQSKGKLNISTKMLFNNGKAVKAKKSSTYYMPKYSWKSNKYDVIKGCEEGYDNRYFDKDGNAVSPDTKDAKQSIDGLFREQMLIREVVNSVDLPSNYNGDGNFDGKVDSLVIITDKVDELSWGTTCWSHMGVVYNIQDNALSRYYMHPDMQEEYNKMTDLYLGGALVAPYNFIPMNKIIEIKSTDRNPFIKVEEGSERHIYNTGLLCHELIHTIGLYDYYSYEKPGYESVGEYDIMGNDYASMSNMLGYMRYKLGWLDYDDILYINDSSGSNDKESYTIYPQIMGKGKAVCKIVLSNYFETGQYFMVEARSQAHATNEVPFDGGLTTGLSMQDKIDSGLIIYRVNENASYINSSGKFGTIGYGNMFGEDEVYVYRAGNGEKLYTDDKLLPNLPCGLFGNKESKQRELYVDGFKYDMTSFGNSDKSKTTDNLAQNITSPSETIISYSDGSNSGIVFYDIKINAVDGSITFKVDLPEGQGTMPVISPDKVKIEQYFANGRNRLMWKTDVKSGTAHVLAVRPTNRLKRLAENHATNITIENFKEEKLFNYKVLYSAKVPLAEKWCYLPEFEDDALIFIALESDNGNCAVTYVGCIEQEDQSFGQYLLAIFDPLYITIGSIIIVVLISLVISLISRSAANRRAKNKK